MPKQKIALNYFIKHQKELCKRFLGKELLLSGRKIIAAFDSLGEAVEAGEQKFGDGNYSVYSRSGIKFSFKYPPKITKIRKST